MKTDAMTGQNPEFAPAFQVTLHRLVGDGPMLPTQKFQRLWWWYSHWLSNAWEYLPEMARETVRAIEVGQGAFLTCRGFLIEARPIRDGVFIRPHVSNCQRLSKRLPWYFVAYVSLPDWVEPASTSERRPTIH